MKIKLNYKRLYILPLLFITISISAQQLTIGNNLLYDATLTPNLRMGVRLSPHWSMGLIGGYRPWPTDDEATRKYKHLLISPDLRYWKDSVNVHHFFGINPVYVHYNISGIRLPFNLYQLDKEKRYQGDFFGLGAFYGYSWPLGRHWNLEAAIGAVVGYTKYNTYECGHCGRKLGTEKKVLVFPQAALNIVYNIPGRPRQVEEPVMQMQTQPVPEAPVTAAVVQKPFVPVLTPVPDFTGRAGQLQQDNPVIQHISKYRPYDSTRILRKEKEALFVHFELAKFLLKGDFRDNQQVLDRIVDITRQIMADSTSSVKTIQIIGLASIEGNPVSNERLAQNRAMALQEYIQQEVSVPDSLFETVGGGEAWAEFRDQLNDIVAAPVSGAPVEALRQALDIVDNEPDAVARERKLRRMNGGRTWKYIKEQILSDQRNSGYIRIYFDYVPDKAAATINEASELLTTDCGDCHREALRLLQTVRNDERAQNALGVALWLCGQKNESLAVFRRAAANGNKDAANNLRQLESNSK